MAVIGFVSLAVSLVSVLTGFIFGCGVASLAAGSVLLIIALFSKSFRNRIVAMYLCAALIFCGSVLTANFVFGLEKAQSHVGDNVKITAKITSEAQSKDSGVIYTLKTQSLDGEKIKVKMRLSSNTLINAETGDTIGFTSKVMPVSAQDKTSEIMNLSRGVYLISYLYEPDLNITSVKSSPHSTERFLQNIRDNIRSRIYYNLPNENGAVAIAMLLGDTSGISDKTENAFAVSGVSHLFAVSGLHLSIWAMGLYYILSHLKIRRNLSSLTVIIFTVFFMALTGFTESVSRAGFMLIIMLFGNLFSRQSDPVNSLGAATAVLMAINPFSSASVSLLLSFSSTLGILLLFKPIERFYLRYADRIKPKVLRRAVKAVLSVVAISICAMAASFPVNTAVFGGISLVSPLTNLLVSFPSTVLMVCAGFSSLTFSFSSIGKAFALVCGLMSKYVIAVTQRLSQLKYAFIETDNIFFVSAAVLALSGTVCCFILINQRRRAVRAAVALTVCICIVTGSFYAVYSHSLIRISALNVGDGICVTAENNSKMFVLGCGGSDYDSVQNIKDNIKNKDLDFLLVPNTERHNSYSADEIIKDFEFKRIFCSEAYGKATVSSAFCLNPWEGASVEFCRNGGAAYAYCVFGNTDLLVLFDCASAQAIPEKCLEADVLICSYYLPQNFDIGGFKNVIISSSDEIAADVCREISKEAQNIYSVADYKLIGVDIRKDNIKFFSEGG